MMMMLSVPLIAVVLGGWPSVSVPAMPDAVLRYAMLCYSLLYSTMIYSAILYYAILC